MTPVSATRRGRAAAERRMVDACVIRRPGPTVTDPQTGVVAATWTDVYAGPCEVQESSGFSAAGSAPDAGEHTYTVQRYVLKVPMTAASLAEGDTVTMTASVLDPSLVGREYRVAQEFAKTFATARRVEVEETTA